MGRARLPLFEAGDSLRGLAALAIVGYHLLFLAPGAGPYGAPLAYGIGGDVASVLGAQLVVGLPVFFALSGYVIGRPFVLAAVAGGRLPAFGPYLHRRARRILPAFWAVAAVTVLLAGASGTSAVELVALFSLAQPLAPGRLSEHLGQAWSLHVEAAFYVAVPVVAALVALAMRRLARAGVRAAVVAAVVAGLGAASFAAHVTGPAEADHDLASRFYAFVPGLALALGEPWSGRLAGRAAAARAGVLLPALAVGALVVLAVVRPSSRAVWEGTQTLAAGALVAGPLLYQWARSRGPRALAGRHLRWLGSRSYSLYLVHVPVMALVLPRLVGEGAALGERWHAALLCGALSLLLADLSFRCVERPFLSRRTAARGPEPAAPAGLA